MTLEEAIEGLEFGITVAESKKQWQLANAYRLGIEALKAWEKYWNSGILPEHGLLPGETED